MPQQSDEVSSHGRGAAGAGVALSDDVVAFIESGVSIVIAVVGPGGRALPGRALAARMTGENRIRLVLAEEGNAAVLSTARSGGPIAATFSAPLSHRTVQIKGYSCRQEDPDPEDAAALRGQTDAFAAVLVSVGQSPSFVQAFSDYRSAALCALSFPVDMAFEQTPGPGAGRSL